ncbi:MAG: hypothetical protein HY262_06550 [Chloroflexi bacterium]|nr:hypothetical protein [Chloroflexota bacterium]
MIAIALGVVALILCVVALAATPGFTTSGTSDPGGLAKYSVALAGASGFGFRAYLLHRHAGLVDGVRSAIVEGGAMALLLLGMFVLAFAVSPSVASSHSFEGDAWLGILATGIFLALVSGVLWERNDRRRRTVVALLVAGGLIAGGIAGLRIGGGASAIGGVVLVVGIAALSRAWLRAFHELKQETAEPIG